MSDDVTTAGNVHIPDDYSVLPDNTALRPGDLQWNPLGKHWIPANGSWSKPLAGPYIRPNESFEIANMRARLAVIDTAAQGDDVTDAEFDAMGTWFLEEGGQKHYKAFIAMLRRRDVILQRLRLELSELKSDRANWEAERDASDAAAQGDAVAGVMEIADSLAETSVRLGYSSDAADLVADKLRDAIAALVARADAVAERAERAELDKIEIGTQLAETKRALVNAELDIEVFAGAVVALDALVSSHNASLGAGCMLSSYDDDEYPADAIAAARGRVREVRDAD